MNSKYGRLFFILILLFITFLLTSCDPTPTPGPNNIPYYPGCSESNLIGHIGQANSNPGPDVIHLDPNCTYTLETADNTANVGNITVRNGLPVITSNIKIYGYNAKIIIIPEEGEDPFGHFFIDVILPPEGEEQDYDKFGDLTLYDVELERGFRPVGGAVINLGGDFIASNVRFYQNYAGTSDPAIQVKGGAIYNQAGQVWVIDNTLFERNQATNLTLAPPGFGGAIYSIDGRLQVTSTVFNNNYGEQYGGAIYAERNPGGDNSGMVTIQDSDFTDNHTLGNGGAIALINEVEGAIIVTSNFDQNWSTNYGGAIYSVGSVVDADHNQFHQNEADFGGAVFTKRIAEGELSAFRTSESYYINNTASEIGGGIFSENSDLEVSDSYFEANSAESCGAIRNGGYPALDVRAGDLDTAVTISSSSTIVNTQINFNHALGLDGGGICHVMGDLIVRDSIISGNTAPDSGGGMLIQDGAELVNNLFVINMADRGGGVYIGHPRGLTPEGDPEYEYVNSLDFFTLIGGSTFSANSSNGSGGGLYAHSDGTTRIEYSTFKNNTAVISGGGVTRGDGKMFINNSTFSSNSAYRGGAIYASFHMDSRLGIKHSTFAFNVATDNTDTGPTTWGGGALNAGRNVTVENSLIYQNWPMDCQIANGSNYSASNTYDSDGTCSTLTEPNPDLGPLQNNGGGTMTHALYPTSPLIDIMPDCAGLVDDQRGVIRPLGHCEPGAYELDPENPPEVPDYGEIIGDPEPISLEPDDCDPFADRDLSLVMLNIAAGSTDLTLYVKIEGGIPSALLPAIQSGKIVTAMLGSTEANLCNLQGFEDRIYCMFTLPPSVLGTVQDLSFLHQDCGDPILTMPRTSIPVPKLVCKEGLGEEDCKAAGGQMEGGRTTAPKCVCP